MEDEPKTFILDTAGVGELSFETDGGAIFRVRAEVEVASSDSYGPTGMKVRFLDEPRYSYVKPPRPKEPASVGSIHKNSKGQFVRIGWTKYTEFHWMNLHTGRLHGWDEVTAP